MNTHPYDLFGDILLKCLIAGHAPEMSAVTTADIVGNCTASQGRQVAEGFQDIVEYLHSKLPTTHIVIMAILPKVRALFIESVFLTSLSELGNSVPAAYSQHPCTQGPERARICSV